MGEHIWDKNNETRTIALLVKVSSVNSCLRLNEVKFTRIQIPSSFCLLYFACLLQINSDNGCNDSTTRVATQVLPSVTLHRLDRRKGP